ncbi:MAG: ATP phosphoribosyltransferase regulatory subunit [Planktomarina sp.]
MSDKMTQTARILELFEKAGAKHVETDILLPAKVMLDLYGEDIRGRAYVTHDPIEGEMMLRPDFTVPVVQRHMADKAEPARYCYTGPVFRQQMRDARRPSEYTQVGYEVFAGGNAADVEAEVFGLFRAAVSGLAVVGDVGLLVAAVDSLTTSEARKKALKRHIWRPARFDALLERFSKPVVLPKDVPTGPEIGLRTMADVQSRLTALEDEASAQPIPDHEIKALRDMLAVEGTLSKAVPALRKVADVLPEMAAAVVQFEARIDAFASKGLAVDDIEFRASYGLTAMEYYDGFVFGILNAARPDGPPLASGGRYDALTAILGQGASVPAVGGVVRVEMLGDAS